MVYAGEGISYEISNWIVNNVPFLGTDVFGTPVGNYILAMLCILLTAILGKIIYYIFKTYVRRFTEKTKTEIDDIIIDMIEEPLVVFLVIIGLWLSIFLFINLDPSAMSLTTEIRDVLIVIDIIWLISRLFDKLFDIYVVPYAKKTKSKLDDQLIPILKDGIRLIIFGIGFLFIIQNAGYDITAILGGLGIAGLAVAMAARTSLEDVLGGAVIFANQPFELYDFVKFGDFSGTVEEINLRYCRLKTLDGTELIVPNSVIAKTVIENYSRSEKRRVDMKIGVVYETSYKKLEKAKQILKNIINRINGVDNPTVYVEEFGDFAIIIRFRYYVTDVSKRLELIDKVNMEIKKEFDKSKIEFAYPTSVIYLKK